MADAAESYQYRVPDHLLRTPTPLKRVLVVGSCLISALPEIIRGASPGCEADYISSNNVVELPARPPAPIESYDFQVVQIAMRSILPEGVYFRLDYDDYAAYHRLLEETKDRLSIALDFILRYAVESHILTFVSNFLVPQVNPYGRILPRYDLRNPIYFFEEINKFLHARVAEIANCHVFDVDQIAASWGKKYIQDDAVWQINHASALSNADLEGDQSRLEPVRSAGEVYQLRIYEFVLATWAEIVATYRSIKKVDTVKLVITDLDDTLWRGVFAEEGLRSLEGWPLGFAEALLILKKRGVILGIASKNDPDFIETNFDSIFGRTRLRLDDFAVRKIGWMPKVESVGEIIRQVNVLPNSVVFIDDNPAERASIQEAFPAVRVLGADLYSTRRILLWAPETQVAEVTKESSKRTEMVAAQVERETQRTKMSREEFLASLNVRVTPIEIGGAEHPRFSRVAELVNKSNQFNTSGQRWSEADWTSGFVQGLKIYAFEVQDRFTEYGLVVVALVNRDTILQFVMSCRVIGLGVEETAVAFINQKMISSGVHIIKGIYKQNELNYLCKDLFERTGFQPGGEAWTKPAEPCVPVPDYVRLD